MEPSGFEQVDQSLGRVSLRTPTLPPATRTNTYLLGERELCVVDPAPIDTGEQDTLIGLLKERQSQGQTVKALVLTHHHNDHVGATERLAAELKVPVLAHPETISRVHFKVDAALRDGDSPPCDGPQWVGIHTPGHAAGHLCFLRQTDQALIAGDMVAGVGTILVDPTEGSMREYMASLEALKLRVPSVLFPAHGFEMRPGVDHLQRYLDHRNARLDAILSRLDAGDRTPEDMVPHIYVGTPTPFFGLAARSVLSMLILLHERKLVRSDEEGWYRTGSDA